jgi:hypothetical protein
MRNLHTEFVGIAQLKKEHSAQLAKFEVWAKRGYGEFHQNHYDWWAFPIDKPSSYAFKYVVFDEEISEMQQDKFFLSRHRRGLELACESWGWDLNNARFLSPDALSHNQRWQVKLL